MMVAFNGTRALREKRDRSFASSRRARRTRAYLGSAECTDYYNIEKAVEARATARLNCHSP